MSFPRPGTTRTIRSNDRPGFALVVTISLLVLIMIISVGLLSLSVISMRSGTASSARQQAMTNARLALIIALGELQGAAGPDQRISAPAAQVNPEAPRAMTGIWRGYRADSSAPTAEPDGQFERWLVSHTDPAALGNPAEVPQPSGRTTRLIDDGSLGSDPNPLDRLSASIVDVNHGDGGYAFAVLDESAKARIDLDPKASPYGEIGLQANLGEARRFGVESITELGEGGFEWWRSSGQERLISLPSGRLLPGAPEVGRFSNDLTTWSRGLLTDTARGGLRRDLSVMFENMPDDFARGKIYQDEAAANAASNPFWALLQDYATLYQDVGTSDQGGYQVTTTVPRGHRPYRDSSGTVTPTPGALRGGYPLMPVVTKLEMVFSIFSKNAHGGWGGYTEDKYIGEDGRRTDSVRSFQEAFKDDGWIYQNTRDANRRYMLYMIYSPIVTVYNPYNIPLEFDQMRVAFKDLPIGFNYYVNGRPLLTKLAHLNQMYVSDDGERAATKDFALFLRSDFDERSAPVVIPPGETIVFGNSARPDWNWHQTFDYRGKESANTRTIDIPVIPGWSEASVGYSVDWLTPRNIWTSANDNMGILSLRQNDTIDVEFGPMESTVGNTSFTATIDIVQNRRNYPAGIIEMKYGSQQNLTDALTDQVRPITLPQRFARPRGTMEVYEQHDKLLKNFARTLSFALFTFRNKVTMEAGTATRPGVSHPPTQFVSSMDFSTDNPAFHSLEAALVPFEDPRFNNERGIQIDGNDRGYGFTGHSQLTGIRCCPLHEIPVLPLQSIAQLRHAQLASSGHLPGFTYTVGESWAHPLIPAGSVVVERGPQGYPLLDHTWLANTELWDSSFFSTICSYDGVAFGGSAASPMSEVLTNFLDGSRPLLNSRLSPKIPAGRSPADLATELAADDELFLNSANYLWVEGPFNVNSVSEQAWKAVLGSLSKSGVDSYDALGGGPENSAEVDNPLLRQRRPAGPLIDDDSDREARWRGFRSLGQEQIDDLARSIVEVVKERGPFLSIADFVNRRPGEDTDAALKGALQEAIDRSEVNAMFEPDSRENGRGQPRGIPLAEAQADGFAFPEAIAGENAAGAPGYLSQGDILSALGTTVAARGDTFRIRAYGESRSGNKVTARAWCEAVVQRSHNFVDPSNPPDTAVTGGELTTANREFGRRFELVAFRWLSPEEV